MGTYHQGQVESTDLILDLILNTSLEKMKLNTELTLMDLLQNLTFSIVLEEKLIKIKILLNLLDTSIVKSLKVFWL